MAPVYRKTKKNRSMEMIVIYSLILLAAIGSAWLPFLFSQLSQNGGGTLIP